MASPPPTPLRTSRRVLVSSLAALTLATTALAACADVDDLGGVTASGDGGSVGPDDLAAPSSGASTGDDPTGTATVRQPRGSVDPEPSPPVPLGTPDRPFGPLPPTIEARAVRTSTGVVVPVIDEREDSRLVSTPCQDVRFLSGGEPIGRAHVVLDPGHGGAEPGAVGPTTGLAEKDLNLRVARHAADLLREAGATVVLTREADHTMTAASRGLVAAAIEPALLVSVHHNGGGAIGDGGPGTIVITGTGSAEATRFGGLFHQTLSPMLVGAGEYRREEHRLWNEAMDRYDAELAAHRASIVARDAALVANGQVAPESTTTIPPTTVAGAGALRVPQAAATATTTTRPPTGPDVVPVPDTLPAPTPPEGEPVPAFRWAGTGNGGVRAWTRPDGRDYLAVLRHADEVPAALAEFVYLSNPSEESLLAEEGFVEREAEALAEAITRWFAGEQDGTGFVADQHDDQPIGGSGGIASCVEPPLE